MGLTRRHFLGLAAGATAVAALPARAETPLTLGGDAFGSYWRATVPPHADTGAISRAFAAIVAEIDATMSPYRPESELNRINRAATRDAMPVSAGTAKVLEKAFAIARASGGSFDPSVGPLVARYGFGPLDGHAVGHFEQFTLSDGGIAKAEPGLSLDLCGIAKGHALDRMAAAAEAAGLDAFMIELGGEVHARGTHPSGRDWQIAVEMPLPDAAPLAHLLALRGRSVATSGDIANGYAVGGRRYSHIIDPRTGEPVMGAIASVSVVADDAMSADGLATALMAMGFERAAAFAETAGIDALFILREGAGARAHMTGAIADHLLS